MNATRLAWFFLAVLFVIYLGDWLRDMEWHFVVTETRAITREQYEREGLPK
jgi:hypothetical protein